MIWIQMTPERSIQAFGVNVARHDNGSYRVYVERTAGNSHVVYEGDKETALAHKEAIDWAIKNGHSTYQMFKTADTF